MKNHMFLLILSVCLGFTTGTKAQSYQDAANHSCLKCHSKQTFTFKNEVQGKDQKRMMNPYYILDTTALVNSVHHTFDCTDCHSYEYTAYPHKGELKLEPLSSCLDCHAGDEQFASYQFEKINDEFKKSVHHEKSGESFTCSKCHNPHNYKPTARISNSIDEIVGYSNQMCLSCHADVVRFQMESSMVKPEIAKVHDWLPNQKLHFDKVRCIECHTQVIDSLNVSHNIVRGENAVKDCNLCHSENTMLKASLYKYQNIRARSENGSLGKIVQNEAYIIGANQNPMLKYLSLIIFGMTIAGIVLHLTLRMLKKRKNGH